MISYQYLNFDIFEKKIIQLYVVATFTLVFLVNDILFGRINSYMSTGTMVHVMYMFFMFFAVFKNLKSSF